MKLHKDNDCGLPPRDCGYEGHWMYIDNMGPASPPSRPPFMDGRENDPIAVVDEDDLVEEKWRNPLVGSRKLKPIPPHEADIERLTRVDVSNYWDESLEDVQ